MPRKANKPGLSRAERLRRNSLRTKENRRQRIFETRKKLRDEFNEVFLRKKEKLIALAKRLLEEGKSESFVLGEVVRSGRKIAENHIGESQISWGSPEVTLAFLISLKQKMRPIIVRLRNTIRIKRKKQIAKPTKYEKSVRQPSHSRRRSTHAWNK